MVTFGNMPSVTRSISESSKKMVQPYGEDSVDAPFDDVIDGPNTKGSKTKFQVRRTATQGLYDVALLMANVSQLKAILDLGQHKYHTVLISLLGTSISLHLFSALLLYVVLIIEKYTAPRRQLRSIHNENLNSEKDKVSMCSNCSEEATCVTCKRVYIIDCIATMCVFLVTVLNVFVTAFGSDINAQVPKKT